MNFAQKTGVNQPLSSFSQEFQKSLPVVPQGCTPLKGGCMVPPLAECRSDLKAP
jgi:hypothetical protein